MINQQLINQFETIKKSKKIFFLIARNFRVASQAETPNIKAKTTCKTISITSFLMVAKLSVILSL